MTWSLIQFSTRLGLVLFRRLVVQLLVEEQRNAPMYFMLFCIIVFRRLVGLVTSRGVEKRVLQSFYSVLHTVVKFTSLLSFFLSFMFFFFFFSRSFYIIIVVYLFVDSVDGVFFVNPRLVRSSFVVIYLLLLQPP